MNLKKVALPLILGLSFLFAACQESTQTRDKIEDAGEKVENTVEDAGNAVKDGLNNAGEAIEEAGDSIKDATN
jgi:predicted small secreted protein